ncbi:MAG: hypothetical protein LR017_02000 [Candidatus Pacebacteria bacterium]|nr:hypothetical protein [Candidatus Paceibacterota bacterium]
MQKLKIIFLTLATYLSIAACSNDTTNDTSLPPGGVETSEEVIADGDPNTHPVQLNLMTPGESKQMGITLGETTQTFIIEPPGNMLVAVQIKITTDTHNCVYALLNKNAVNHAFNEASNNCVQMRHRNLNTAASSMLFQLYEEPVRIQIETNQRLIGTAMVTITLLDIPHYEVVADTQGIAGYFQLTITEQDDVFNIEPYIFYNPEPWPKALFMLIVTDAHARNDACVDVELENDDADKDTSSPFIYLSGSDGGEVVGYGYAGEAYACISANVTYIGVAYERDSREKRNMTLEVSQHAYEDESMPAPPDAPEDKG